MKIKKIAIRSLLALLVLFTGAEAAVRLVGMVDFPIYHVDSEIGYIPMPNQSGQFLNKNSWVFNDRSMGTEVRWNPTSKNNLLLIGNSIIMGGNPYNQPDKLGPLIQESLGNKVQVWPIAAGGWSNVNQSVYLQRNPDVVASNGFFIWEYMNGGFSQLSPDRGQYVFPSQKPVSALWYVMQKYALPKLMKVERNELPPTGNSKLENIRKFEELVAKMSLANGKKTPGMIFMYPSKDEFIGMKNGTDYVPDRKELERIAAAYGLKILDVAKQPQWSADIYRDGVHPTVAGNKILAGILSSAVSDALK